MRKQPHWKRKPLKKDNRRWTYAIDFARPGSTDYTAVTFARIGDNGKFIFSGMQVYRPYSISAYAMPAIT